jgi:hypothetical protein
MTYDKELATEIFRNAVLAALDEAAAQIFGISIPARNSGVGATDADLPALFKTIDAQLERLSVRYGHPLFSNWVGSPRYMQDRAFLRASGFSTIDDEALQ